MNKKILAAGMAALMFAACSGSTASSGQKEEKATVTTDGSETTAVLTKDAEGKLVGVSIDVVDADGNSKKEAGDDYNMKGSSPIGKEWYEQVNFLENYILEHGVDSVKLDADGYAESEDVKSGCTINLKDIMEAVDEANAK